MKTLTFLLDKNAEVFVLSFASLILMVALIMPFLAYHHKIPAQLAQEACQKACPNAMSAMHASQEGDGHWKYDCSCQPVN